MTKGELFSPMAEPCRDISQPAWYCVRSHLKHEHIAAAHLALLPGVEAFNPQLRLLRSTRRGRVWCTESIFPNYLFASFVLEVNLEKVSHTPSVTSVLRFGDTFPAIPKFVIEGLRRDLDVVKSKVLTDAPDEGDDVEVAAGAFKGLKGPVVRVLPAKQRVAVLLDFMGRHVAAELSLDMLLFRKREAASLVLPEAGLGSACGQSCLHPVPITNTAVPFTPAGMPHETVVPLAVNQTY